MAARPPRSVPPGRTQQQQQRQSHSRSPAPPYPEQSQHHQQRARPELHNKGSVSFQKVERGDRNDALDVQRQRNMLSAYQNQLSPTSDSEYTDFPGSARVGRQKSLVRPDRERIEPGHRQWHYRAHAAQAAEGNERVDLLPSST